MPIKEIIIDIPTVDELDTEKSLITLEAVEEVIEPQSAPLRQVMNLSTSEFEYVDIGAEANDGTGDPLRTAFDKINQNFVSIDATKTSYIEVVTSGSLPNQVLYEIPVNAFTMGEFSIRSSDTNTNDSQSVNIDAQITNCLNSVSWSAHHTIFVGTPLTRYDMDVSNGNVRIMISPLVSTTMSHLIVSKVISTAAIAYASSPLVPINY